MLVRPNQLTVSPQQAFFRPTRYPTKQADSSNQSWPGSWFHAVSAVSFCGAFLCSCQCSPGAVRGLPSLASLTHSLLAVAAAGEPSRETQRAANHPPPLPCPLLPPGASSTLGSAGAIRRHRSAACLTAPCSCRAFQFPRSPWATRPADAAEGRPRQWPRSEATRRATLSQKRRAATGTGGWWRWIRAGELNSGGESPLLVLSGDLGVRSSSIWLPFSTAADLTVQHRACPTAQGMPSCNLQTLACWLLLCSTESTG